MYLSKTLVKAWEECSRVIKRDQDRQRIHTRAAGSSMRGQGKELLKEGRKDVEGNIPNNHITYTSHGGYFHHKLPVQ